MNILSIPGAYGLSIPQHGGQNRYSNLVKQLRKSNSVIVLAPDRFVTSTDFELAKICHYREFSIRGRRSTYYKDLDVAYVLKLLHILKNEPIDLIEIHFPSGFFVARLLSRLLAKDVPLVYCPQNVESDYIDQVFARDARNSMLERAVTRPYIKLYERIVCKYLAKAVIAVSENDRIRFVKKYNLDDQKVAVVPSGCSIRKLPRLGSKRVLRHHNGIDPDAVVCVFHGSYDHPPNKEAMRVIRYTIAPMFEKTARVLFLLCGAGMPRFEEKNVLCLGYVNDLFSTISLADIAIVPLLSGGGTKTKMFDYMNAGLPIVTTRTGAEGINARNCEHMVIVETVDEEFVQAIKELTYDEGERNRLGTNGRLLAEEEYSWDKIGKTLSSLYSQIQKRER
jgi:glycosyltransferase involved in cell wall biosynthesis